MKRAPTSDSDNAAERLSFIGIFFFLTTQNDVVFHILSLNGQGFSVHTRNFLLLIDTVNPRADSSSIEFHVENFYWISSFIFQVFDLFVSVLRVCVMGFLN